MTGAASGTLYIKIVENNPDVATASNITVAGNSGQATIVPGSPAALLAGTHQGSFTVHACLNDPTCASGELAGSPQTISVTYQIGSSVDADTVTPRVAVANTVGAVILRGHGFTGAHSVSFGTTPAASVSVVSDSEIHASYPPLAGGSYAIAIDSGNVAYTAALSVVKPPAFPAAFLSYPASVPSPASIGSISYDAERNALLVVTGSTLLRYAFDGSSWGTPTQVSIKDLQQVSVAPDGQKLLALTAAVIPIATNTPIAPDVSMEELDPVTLAQTANTPITQPSVYGSTGTVVADFAYANDGNAIVWASSALDAVYAYGISSRTWTSLYDTTGEKVDGPSPVVGSGDGSTLLLGVPDEKYVASTGAVNRLTPSNTSRALSSADLSGSEFATSSEVTGPEGQVLGNVPAALGSVINSAGTRLYAVDPADSQPELHTYDLTAAANGGDYPELGTPITLAGDPRYPGLRVLLALTPDGGTVFIAGSNGIAVQQISP